VSAASAATHVLVVEDDPHLAAGVMENLRAEGYEVTSAGTGEQALEWLAAHGCALIVLDVMLPGVDGFGVCRSLRERGDSTPVLFLTARGDPPDRVRGLEAGGDDYLAKPFHLQEFLLRVRAIVRRWEWYRSASATAATALLRFGGNEVDFRAFRARAWNGEAQELTEKEAMILKVRPSTAARSSRARTCSSAYGATTYFHRRARWTTSSCACASASRRIPPTHATS